MATFENYEYDKWFWFATYLELAAAISKDPSLSVKNSSFKDEMDVYFKLKEMERVSRYGITYGTK